MIWPKRASNFAVDVDHVAIVLTAISGIIVLVLIFLLVYFCTKYHNSKITDRSMPKKKSTPLELTLVSIIFIFGLSTFVWATRVFYQMYMPPSDALDVLVIGKQWMWTFQAQGQPDQINYLKLPLGKPVRLLMTSQDVIHSFYVPAFRLKQDLLPGRYTSLWFIPKQLGRFDVHCAEFCGLSHSKMSATIEIVPADSFYSSVQRKNSVTELGQKIFVTRACNTCHEGTARIGPPLNGIYGKSVNFEDGRSTTADDIYLRNSILYPASEIVKNYPPSMPSYQGLLSEKELYSLIQFIKSNREEFNEQK
jgi:cytochrome c oxidase subunit 2